MAHRQMAADADYVDLLSEITPMNLDELSEECDR
jgi:hypothetical protein